MLDTTFSLRTYVAELFDNGFDDETIVPALIRRAETNLSLRSALLAVGAKQAVRTYFNDARSEAHPIRGARSAASPDKKADQAKMVNRDAERRRAAKENRRTLFDTYTLWGHTSLRDATKDDLKASIANRKTQMAGSMKALKFEEAIYAELPDGKTCAQAFWRRQDRQNLDALLWPLNNTREAWTG